MFRIHTSMLVLAVTMIMTGRGVASNERISNVDQAGITDKEQRVERSVIHDLKNCETWAPWVNDNHPTSSNQEDKEVISPQTLSDFCPVGQIANFECKVDNGDPFKTNITDPNGIFLISCYYVGVTCKLLFPIRLCPDIAIRYFCTCKLPLTNTTHSDTGIEDTTLDIGGLSLPMWAFVLTVTGLMFIINTCISVCLYRKGAQRLKEKHQRKIHPMKSVRCSVYE